MKHAMTRAYAAAEVAERSKQEAERCNNEAAARVRQLEASLADAEKRLASQSRTNAPVPPPPPQPTAPAPAAETARAKKVATEWTAEGWLGSVGLERLVAIVLLGVGFEGDQLDALRALGRSDTLEEDLRAQFLAYVEWFVGTLAPRLQALAKGEAATVGEMQDKFSQDARGFLEYGSLNVFFGGLEGQVGSPSPKVWQMMAEEHTNRGDSNCTFSTSNYSLTSTSSIEYKFVAEPDAPPSEGWPVEDKIRRAEIGDEGADYDAIRASGAKMRQPRPLAELEADMERLVNVVLKKLGEPLLTIEEAIGLRLYTGPLYATQHSTIQPAQLGTTDTIQRDALAMLHAGLSNTTPCFAASRARCHSSRTR